MRKPRHLWTNRLKDETANASCPRQGHIPRQHPSRKHNLSDFSILHLTTRASNPLICPESECAPPQHPKLLEHSHREYGEIGTYPTLTRGPVLAAETFSIRKVPWGALRDTEIMCAMELTDAQMITVLRAKYPRCGALQGIGVINVVHMIYYYRENEHCRVAAPWPETLREEWFLKARIMDVLRSEWKP